MQAVRLTHTIIDDLEPKPKRYYVSDTEARGLRIYVTPHGHKSFCWVGRAQNKVTRVTIGTYDAVKLDDARVKAKRFVADAAEGKAVTKDRRKTPTGTLLGDAFAYWFENHVKKHRQHHKMLQDRFSRSFSDWRDRSIESIGQSEVEERHTEISLARGPVAANMAVALLGQIIRYAKPLGFTGDDPTKSIRRFEELARERFLLPDEVPKFFDAVNALETDDARDFFLLCLWTGARKGNVCSMEFSEIHGDVWTIPKAKAKKKRAIHIPLVPQAMEIINRRRRLGSRFVFPSSKSTTGHYMGGQSAWRKIKKTKGLEDIRIHDLRRTLGSWQAAGGTSELIIGRTLGHASTESTRIYARLHLDPVREAITQATSALEKASKKKSSKRTKSSRDVP